MNKEKIRAKFLELLPKSQGKCNIVKLMRDKEYITLETIYEVAVQAAYDEGYRDGYDQARGFPPPNGYPP